MEPYALFIGCNIPARLEHYESSARAVLRRLDVPLEDFREFNCCGYPMRNTQEGSFLLSSAKNLAVAEKAGLNILTLCKCCFGTLKTARHRLMEDDRLMAIINRQLAPHGLTFNGHTQVYHFLSVLHQDVGIEAIRTKIKRTFKDLNIATHYGCHALRPSAVTQFDDPTNPVLFDDLVSLTGAKSVEWENRLECCGAPLTGINDPLSQDLTRKKLESATDAGAAYLCSACPWCQLQFDTVQAQMISEDGSKQPVPSILYPQLLGLSLGIDGDKLGIDANRLSIREISKFMNEV